MCHAETGSSAITAENVYELFPEVEALSVVSLTTCGVSATESGDFEGYDEEQVRMMDEVCIALDVDDEPISRASKECVSAPPCEVLFNDSIQSSNYLLGHLMTNIDKGLLHRAFSCFVFDSQRRLLLQQRADKKITFPMMWTNTCCSHPLDIPGKRGTGFKSAILGAKRAARRKLEQELGIKPEQVPLEDFHFLTRVHYKAPSDGKWGEHEMDHILFIQADVDLAVNRNEVQDSRWVSPEDLKKMFPTPGLQYTPWFKLICESLLFKWWANLGTPEFHRYTNETIIRRM
ncbi:isopentenyl-diphosphate delta3-delta2-isomerase [Aspergillus transmontanensis]|uniref:isopentenyl-diphosphate Delta-isomerase n=1 Tax=Aspergillus transmontanensis TaxID=1034304 RepID=A0A5N6VK06_9EURO|nr:isopentenyl-diphosphate delta3-delta2-isomerase [Aspergillus transmontanensis]